MRTAEERPLLAAGLKGLEGVTKEKAGATIAATVVMMAAVRIIESLCCVSLL